MKGPYYVTSEAKRLAAWGPPGLFGDGPQAAVTIQLDGRPFAVNRLGKEAWERFDDIRALHGYHLTGRDTGFYNYRHMRHNDRLPWSVHAWAMALDINWLENPAGSKLVTDLPAPMIVDLLALRTESGARVFRWGADWDWDGDTTDHSYVDAMHWEVVAHPLDLDTGIRREPDMTLTPEEIATVKELHASLKAVNSNASFARYAVRLTRELRQAAQEIVSADDPIEQALERWEADPDGSAGGA